MEMVLGSALIIGDTAAMALPRSEEHTSELQSRPHLVCRLLLEKKKRERLLVLHDDARRLIPRRSAVRRFLRPGVGGSSLCQYGRERALGMELLEPDISVVVLPA